MQVTEENNPVGKTTNGAAFPAAKEENILKI